MRNNKMKGFTLVELLVVIAILAILATVSVVGYTSYIESTNITVDENLAAQLNRFLEAYKVNFTGDIDENNIREVTLEILKEGGLEGQLIAKSKDRDFYFDLKDGKYVLRTDEESGILTPGYKVFFGLDTLAADGSEYEIKLENCFTDGYRYFYVGSTSEDAPISLIIDAFYNFDSANYGDLETKIENLGISKLSTFVENAVVVTDECNYRLGNDPKYVIFAPGINQIGTKTVTWENGWSDPATADKLATVDGKLTIPASVKYFAANSLNCGANAELHINKTAKEVSEMADDIFSDSKLIVKDGTFYADVLTSGLKGITNKSAENLVEYAFYYVNDLVSFEGKIESGSENKYAVVNGIGHIAWEKGVSITLTSTNFVGEDPSIPATGTDGIVWTSNIGTVSVVNNVATLVVDSITSVNDIPNTITFTGTATNGKTAEYTVEVVYLTSVDYTIDSNSVTTYADGLTLVYGENGKTTFDVAQLLGTPNKVVEGIEFAPAVSITENSNFTYADGVLTPANGDLHGEYAITINTEAYPHLKKDITLDIFNTKNLSLVNAHDNHKYVGTINAITLGDLFAATGKEIPEGAMVLVYNVFGDTKFTFTENTLGKSDLAKANLYALNADWETTPVEFASGSAKFDGANQFKAAVTVVYQDERGNYIRVASSHELMVVDGVNVTSYSDFIDSDNKTLEKNFILYGDVEMSATDPVLTIASGKTLYGSGYYMDMREYNNEGTPIKVGGKDYFHFEGLKKDVPYRKTDEGIIKLYGTLNSVNIVGAVYKSTDFIYQDHNNFAYGASLVKAENGAYIVDCYLANTRSPLRVSGAVTVEDTVLFGGNYANIDVTKNATTLTLKGNVTTINQITEDTPDTVGLGIAVDIFADYKKTSINATDCNLKHYNNVAMNEINDAEGNDRLPVVTYTMTVDLWLTKISDDVNVFLTNEVETVMNNTANDGKLYLHNDEKYINAGIVFMNGLKITVSGVDMTSSVTEAKTGNGQQFTTGQDYNTITATALRPKNVSKIEILCAANVYIWTPDKAKVPFDNIVPENYLPSKVLGE